MVATLVQTPGPAGKLGKYHLGIAAETMTVLFCLEFIIYDIHSP